MIFPYEILIYIYTFDPTYKENYDKCVLEIKDYFNKYKIISTTYNCVNQNNKIFFKKYNKVFYKYILLNMTISSQ